jgi:hypothetical protein
MVIVVVLPLTQLLVEQVDVVGDAVPIEQLVELLIVHAMRALDLRLAAACEGGCGLPWPEPTYAKNLAVRPWAGLVSP